FSEPSGSAGGKDARRSSGAASRRLGTMSGPPQPNKMALAGPAGAARGSGRARRLTGSLLEKLSEMALAEAPLVGMPLAAPARPGMRLHLAEAARAASERDQGGAAAG